MRRWVRSAVVWATLFLCAAGGLAGQTASIQGSVRSEAGDALVGVQVVLHGTTHAAVTGDDGGFLLSDVAAGEYTLVATRIGYEAEERSITLDANAPAIIELALREEAVALQELEVIGSYTTRITGAATRMPLSLRETPQSISVIGRQQIEDQNLRTLDDVLRQTPGIVAQRRDERVNYFSRGFRLSQMVDGVPTLAYNSVAAEASMNNMAIYDRVEVVRGPAGLLNGAGQPGGSINLVRKRPTTELSGRASAGVASWNRYLIEVDVGGPLIASNRVRGRVVGRHTAGDSFIDDKDRGNDVLYGIVELDVTSSTVVSAGLEYERVEIDGANFGSAPPFYNDHTLTNLPRSFSSSASWSVWDMDTRRVFLSLEQRTANGWLFKADASYLRNERERYSADIWLDPTEIDPVTNVGLVQLGDNPAEGTNKSFDVYATGPFDLLGRTHQAVVGFNINQYSYETRTHAAIDTGLMIDRRPVNIFDLDAIEKPDFQYPRLYFGSDSREMAFYASSRFRPVETLSVLVGGRVSWYDNEPWRRAWYGGGSGTVAEGTPVEERGVFTPYLGIVYDLTTAFSAYVSYTDIFQPNTARDSTGNVLDPRRGGTVEGGLKGEHFGGALNTSFAIFQTEEDNVPVLSGAQPDGSPAYAAAKGTRSRGFELTASGQLADGWQLMGGYTYAARRDRDDALVSPNLPTRLLTLVTRYRLPGNWSRLAVGGAATYQNETTLTDPYGLGTITQGDVTLLGFTASYDISDQLSASVNVENATDKGYVSYGATGYVYGNPRNAWLRATYRF